MELRPYQAEAVASLESDLHEGRSPLCVMPTGSGKSLVIAALMAGAVERGQRCLLLTHVRELVLQDEEVFRRYAPGIDSGIFCCAIKRHEIEVPAVFAQVQSLHARLDGLAGAFSAEPFDLVIIDEAHRVPFSGVGQYVSIIRWLRALRPGMPLVGMTATPYRLQGGRLDQGADAWFSGVSCDVPYLDLVSRGFLAPLTGRKPKAVQIDVSGCKIERGDYRQCDIAEATESVDLNLAIVRELVRCGVDCRQWLVFAVNVHHATMLQRLLAEAGVQAGLVTGGTPLEERNQTIEDFRAGGLRALVNVNVLTTGFDAPGIDLLALCRPTASTSLHVQMLGRGSRIAEGKTNGCLVLDFAGNCERLGPITDPVVMNGAPAPLKACPECDAYVPMSLPDCPECGYSWPRPQVRKPSTAYRPVARMAECDPMAAKPAADAVRVLAVAYAIHRKPGRPLSLRIGYKTPVGWFSEWLTLYHPGYGGMVAAAKWRQRLPSLLPVPDTIEEALSVARDRFPVPSHIRLVSRNGLKFAEPLLGTA